MKTEQAKKPNAPKKSVVYSVNGEEQTSEEDRLTVEEILDRAGFQPATDYTLSRDSDGHVFQRLDEVVKLKKHDRFTATWSGPTPVS